jgi:hypothetical protein
VTLDGQTERVYAALDNSGLLSLLLVLRQEFERHARMTLELAKAYRDAAGPDAPPITSLGDVVDRVGATGEWVGAEIGFRETMQAVGLGEVLDDQETWRTFSATYPNELRQREHWVLDELSHRGLLPSRDAPGADHDA